MVVNFATQPSHTSEMVLSPQYWLLLEQLQSDGLHYTSKNKLAVDQISTSEAKANNVITAC